MTKPKTVEEVKKYFLRKIYAESLGRSKKYESSAAGIFMVLWPEPKYMERRHF